MSIPLLLNTIVLFTVKALPLAVNVYVPPPVLAQVYVYPVLFLRTVATGSPEVWVTNAVYAVYPIPACTTASTLKFLFIQT